jgi:hypothetical protein
LACAARVGPHWTAIRRREVTQCRSCSQSLRVVPVVMLHDQDETRRFEAVFSDEIPVTSH